MKNKTDQSVETAIIQFIAAVAKNPRIRAEAVARALSAEVKTFRPQVSGRERLARARAVYRASKASPRVSKPSRKPMSQTAKAKLAAARNAYFRKHGYGKFAKTTKPKSVKKRSVKNSARISKLREARDAYFKKMGYGKYASKAA